MHHGEFQMRRGIIHWNARVFRDGHRQQRKRGKAERDTQPKRAFLKNPSNHIQIRRASQNGENQCGQNQSGFRERSKGHFACRTNTAKGRAHIHPCQRHGKAPQRQKPCNQQ